MFVSSYASLEHNFNGAQTFSTSPQTAAVAFKAANVSTIIVGLKLRFVHPTAPHHKMLGNTLPFVPVGNIAYWLCLRV